jgi:hypothetical protein
METQSTSVTVYPGLFSPYCVSSIGLLFHSVYFKRLSKLDHMLLIALAHFPSFVETQ